MKGLPPGFFACETTRRIYVIDDEMEAALVANNQPTSCRAMFCICGECRGSGKHVNRAIDGNGLPSEFQDDPDFMEEYRAGMYDVVCEACGGRRVMLEPEDWDQPVAKLLSEAYASDRRMDAEVEAERRMGA